MNHCVACIDGMPVYEGSTKVWENYRATLEKEVEMQTTPVNVVNPVEQLNEFFPEAEFEFPDQNSNSGGFFRAQFSIGGNVYEGVGLNKRDAKANAAANTIEALEENGQLGQRQAEAEAKRKERQERQLKQTENSETNKEKQVKLEKSDPKGLSLIPTVKLQEFYPRAEYHVLGETPLRNTPLRAFLTAVVIGEQSFIGVGRSKKLSKSAAAEKALRAMGYWTEEDELAKRDRVKDSKSDVVPPLMGVEGFDPIPLDAGIHSLIGSGQYGRPGRGRSSWNFGSGSRGYQQKGRGRGFGGGYGGQEWYGGAMGDTTGDPALDMMVGELSHLVGQILETNPNMGVSGVWNLLQRNPDYQSWRNGALASNMQTYYQNCGGPHGAEYYGATADPSSGNRYFNYPTETYTTPAAGFGRGRGVNVRSWSRDSATQNRRGGKSNFQNTASFW